MRKRLVEKLCTKDCIFKCLFLKTLVHISISASTTYINNKLRPGNTDYLKFIKSTETNLALKRGTKQKLFVKIQLART